MSLARELKHDLDRMAARADTSSSRGLHNLLQGKHMWHTSSPCIGCSCVLDVCGFASCLHVVLLISSGQDARAGHCVVTCCVSRHASRPLLCMLTHSSGMV
jgi:hypothetical protein